MENLEDKDDISTHCEKLNSALEFAKEKGVLDASITFMAFSLTKYEENATSFKEELQKLQKNIEETSQNKPAPIDDSPEAQLQEAIRKLLKFCNDFTLSQLPIEALEEKPDNSVVDNNELTIKKIEEPKKELTAAEIFEMPMAKLTDPLPTPVRIDLAKLGDEQAYKEAQKQKQRFKIRRM